MSWLDEKCKDLLDQFREQAAAVQFFPELEGLDDTNLTDKHKYLTDCLDALRLDCSDQVELRFNPDHSQCLIIAEPGKITTEDPDALEYLLEVQNSNKTLTSSDLKTLGYTDDWMLDALFLKSDSYLESLGIGEMASNLALFAYDRNKRAVDLIKP